MKILQQFNTFIQHDRNIAGLANFIFGAESDVLIKSINLDILLRLITFYIVHVNTPFLLCLANIDKHAIFFNNITNKIIQTQLLQSYSVIWRYRHAFLLWYIFAYTLAAKSLTLNPYYLTDIELRCLHYHFQYLSMHYVYQLLERSGHNIKLKAL